MPLDSLVRGALVLAGGLEKAPAGARAVRAAEPGATLESPTFAVSAHIAKRTPYDASTLELSRRWSATARRS